MAGTRKSFVYAAAGRYTEFFLFLMGTLVLSRLLTPAEVGLFAAANSVVAFAQNIRSFGTEEYLIQKETLNKTDLRRTLGISILFSWSISLFLVVFSGIIADYFDEPLMKNILIILGFSFVFLPISSTVLSYLMRDMLFAKTSIIRALGALINLIVAISLALNDFGALSIAWATLAANISLLVFCLIIAPRHVTIIPAFSGIAEVFSFGSWVAVTGIIRNAGISGISLIIGKVMSFQDLGIFMRASTIIERFSATLLDIIRSVAMPSFAQIRRDKIDPASHLIYSFGLMAAVLWPFYAFVALFAEPLVIVMFGWQWTAAIPIAQVFAIALIASLNLPALMPTILTAYGHVQVVFIFNLINSALKVAGIIYATQHGLMHVVLVILVSSVFGAIFYGCALVRIYSISLKSFGVMYLRAGLLSVCCLTPSAAAYHFMKSSEFNNLAILTVVALLAFVFWVALSGFLVPVIKKERDVYLGKLRDSLIKIKAHLAVKD